MSALTWCILVPLGVVAWVGALFVVVMFVGFIGCARDEAKANEKAKQRPKL